MALFKNAKPGLWLSLAAAAIALVGAVAYLAIYMATAGDAVDRVFSWLTFGLMAVDGSTQTRMPKESLKALGEYTPR